MSKAENAKQKKSFMTMLRKRRCKMKGWSYQKAVPEASHTVLVFPQHMKVSLSEEVNIRLHRI